MAYAWLTTILMAVAIGFSSHYGLFVLGIFGLLGLIGVWMLFVFDDFKNKTKRILTRVFLTFGLISAISVSVLSFPIGGFQGYYGNLWVFMLTWGLLIFAAIVIYYGRKKLFCNYRRA